MPLRAEAGIAGRLNIRKKSGSCKGQQVMGDGQIDQTGYTPHTSAKCTQTTLAGLNICHTESINAY